MNVGAVEAPTIERSQTCKQLRQAHLVNLSPHPELNAELRIFECEDCGKQTELIVLR
jgi:hypothetical protein